MTMPSLKSTQVLYYFLISLIAVLKIVLFDTHGVDPDEYRLILSAISLVEEGGYSASRLPGYPFVELLYGAVYALTGSLSPIVYNLPNIILSLFMSVYLFEGLKNRQNYFYLALFILGMNVTPVFFINAANAMDYMFAFTFISLAIVGVSRGKWKLPAFFIALAVASRITSGIFAVASILLFYKSGAGFNWKSWWKMGILSFLFYLPFLSLVLYGYGIDFLTYYPGDYPAATKMYRYFLESFGVTGMILLLGLVLSIVLRFKKYKDDNVQLFAAVSAILYLALFFKAPLEGSYLLPLLLCMFLLLMNSRKVSLLAAIMLIFSSMSYSLREGGLKNYLLANMHERNYQESWYQERVKKIKKLSNKYGKLVVLGIYLRPGLRLYMKKNQLVENEDLKVSYFITENDYRRYLSEGYKIYVPKRSLFRNNEKFDLFRKDAVIGPTI